MYERVTFGHFGYFFFKDRGMYIYIMCMCNHIKDVNRGNGSKSKQEESTEQHEQICANGVYV